MVVVLAVTSAFSTVGSNDAALQAVIPHEQSLGANPCIVKTQPCTLTNTGTLCRVGQFLSNPPLWEMEDGECIVPLYKP